MSHPTTSRHGRNARQARLMRIANVPMRGLLSLPFRTPLSGRLMLLYYVGRKTGRGYRQPISYVSDGDVLLTPGGGRWTLSLTDGVPVRVKLRGRTARLTPELVRDPATVTELLDRMSAKNPALKRFVPLPRTPDGRFEPQAVRSATEHGFRIVRWHQPATM